MTGPDEPRGFTELFTADEPLGPSALPESIGPGALRLLYDTGTGPHRAFQRSSPTFIVGRRGSGKTSMLLSRHLDPDNIVVQLRSDGAFSRVRAAVQKLQQSVVVTEEGVADLWALLLWGPVAARLLDRLMPEDPHGEYTLLSDELTPLRAAVRESAHGDRTQDDVVLNEMARRLILTVDARTPILGLDMLGELLQVYSRPWMECVDAARHIIKARGAKVFVLIDSLENIGPVLHDMELTVRGLFHLVGRMGMTPNRDCYRLQCCFPSELWPELQRISANPLKDFAKATILQWDAKDLLHATDSRLRRYLAAEFPREIDDRAAFGCGILPKVVTNRMGVQEPPVSYLLRHTQLLPRQLIHIMNRAVGRAVAARNLPVLTSADLVTAVAEVEAVLCPEIFAAYSHQYPRARDVVERLLPYLPFRFSDSELHRMCNQAGIAKAFDLDYRQVRELLTRLGVLGRFLEESDFYVRAEFEYAIDGVLNLAADDEYCLHPLFVRQFQSRDVRSPQPGTRPVYPTGTPLPE